jgi:DivIVA domain-containing protein
VARLRSPGFTVARRGYDTHDVDKFLEQLVDWLETDAAQAIGQVAVTRKLELVGKSTAHILLTTEQESQELRRQTSEDCAQLRAEAEADARRARDAADAHAQQARAKAERRARPQRARRRARPAELTLSRRADSDAALRRADRDATAGCGCGCEITFGESDACRGEPVCGADLYDGEEAVGAPAQAVA